tara:strand:- start:88 stop:543 length:456 start_codon:yes stop_codon:yes gene_type:complete
MEIMKLVYWVFGMLMSGGSIFVGMLLSGGIAKFLDLPSLFIVVIPTIGTLLIGFRGSFLSSFYAIWGEADSIVLDSAIAFWRALKRCAIGYGCLGFMIGLVAMLASLDDVGSIGPNMAVSLISVLYGLLLGYLIVEPMMCSLETKKCRLSG